MRRIERLVALTVIGLGLACDRNPERNINAESIALTELWSSTTGLDGDPLGSVTGMASAYDGSIWVTDGSNSVILRYASDAEEDGLPSATATGFTFDVPTLITPTVDGGMAILELRYNAIVMTDSTGAVVDSARMQVVMVSPKGFASGPDGSFYVTAGTFLTDRAIFEYNRTGMVVRAWHPVPRPRDFSNRSISNARFVAGGPISVQPDGTILYADAAPHRLQRFPPGDTIAVVIASDSQLVGSIVDEFEVQDGQGGEADVVKRWYFPQSTGFYALPSGQLLSVVTLNEENRSVWELYEESGALLARREVGVPYHAWGMTPDGEVLVSIRPIGSSRARIARVRVNYQPNTE